jgi:phosphate transport system ATP-binding protein
MPEGIRPVARAAAIRAVQFSHFFGAHPTLKNLDLEIKPNEIFGIIGPAGSGKSTFLRALNRLNDLVPGSHVQGRLEVGGADIYAPGTSVVELRRRLGMVFATPVPLPRSIFENVAFGPRLSGVNSRDRLGALVKDALEKTALWAEVKDRLDESGLKLSGGQQQRLCLARILALRPEFILLDEPTSGLDPVSTMRIEEMLRRLKAEYTIVLVTNNTKQAARVADRTAFLLDGELVEVGDTVKIFSVPSDPRTNDYILGRFG